MPGNWVDDNYVLGSSKVDGIQAVAESDESWEARQAHLRSSDQQFAHEYCIERHQQPVGVAQAPRGFGRVTHKPQQCLQQGRWQGKLGIKTV